MEDQVATQPLLEVIAFQGMAPWEEHSTSKRTTVHTLSELDSGTCMVAETDVEVDTEGQEDHDYAGKALTSIKVALLMTSISFQESWCFI